MISLSQRGAKLVPIENRSRLRMRHVHFSIGEAERDAWLRHMESAVRDERLPAEIEAALLEYFERAANFMINRGD
jgi:hemoglobin